MDNKQIEKTTKKVQAALNKLISEEWLSGMAYVNMIALCDPTEVDLISKSLEKLANDEIQDHFMKLMYFALYNGYKIPLSIKDCKKFADKTLVKIFNKLKRQEDAKYYILNVVDAEDIAVASYEQMLNDTEYPDEFLSLIRPIYHEEREHVDEIRTLLFAYDNSMRLSV